MFVNSDTANKLAKNLSMEINRINQHENDSLTYGHAPDETPIVPEYNFLETHKLLEKKNQELAHIRHAIANFNQNTTINVAGKIWTIDEALAQMRYLQNRKTKLNDMLTIQEKSRTAGFGNRQPEIIHRNFDRTEVQTAYDNITKQLMELQSAVNTANLIQNFEI